MLILPQDILLTVFVINYDYQQLVQSLEFFNIFVSHEIVSHNRIECTIFKRLLDFIKYSNSVKRTELVKVQIDALREVS